MWILFVLLNFILGFLTISFYKKDFTTLESIGLGFLIGIGEGSLLMFIIGLFNIPLSTENLLKTFLISAIVLALLSFFKNRQEIFLSKVKLSKSKLNIYEWLLVILILFSVFWVILQAIVWPPSEWDTLALYDFRAKVFSDKLSLATEFLTSQSNLTAYNYVYPFSTSLMHAMVYIGNGNNPQFIYGFYYISLILVIYSILRRYLSRVISLLMTSVIATTPEIIFTSIVAYPNIPFAIYFAFSTLYFWEWIRYKKDGYLIISAILLGLSAWIRNTEPYWTVNIFLVLATLIYMKKYKFAAGYSLIFFSLRQIWPSFQKVIFSKYPDIFFSPPMSLNINLSKIPEVISFVLKYFLDDWKIYIFILFFAIILGFRSLNKNKLIIVWLLSYVTLSIAGTFYFAMTYNWWVQVGGSAKRVSVFFAPLIIYAISVFVADLINDLKEKTVESKIYIVFDKIKINLFNFSKSNNEK